MPAEEAARLLGVSPERLMEYATRGELRAVLVKGAEGYETMYHTSEVLRLKERLRRGRGGADAEEWPDLIGG